MSEQIFISYRRDGGDVYAKLICEALKNRGFSVFYDIESIHGGYFDSRILTAIEGCNDFLLILSPHSLDRCVNEGDWVRQEIAYALKCRKNIIPVMLPGFEFPKTLPEEISAVSRHNAVQFISSYFDAVVDAIASRCTTVRKENEGLQFAENGTGDGYVLTRVNLCTDSEVVIPAQYRGKPVTRIGNEAFRSCGTITHVTVPSGVTSIGERAFFACRSLKHITLPESVADVGKDAFAECTALTELDVPASIYETFGAVFRGCSSLTQITIPVGVTRIAPFAFAQCKSLTAIALPATVTEIGEGAFFGCAALSSVTLPTGVTQIGKDAFFGCASLTSVTLPHTLTEIGANAFAACDLLTRVDLPDGLMHVGDGAFGNCSLLKTLMLPGGLCSIGEYAFLRCTSLGMVLYRGKKQAWERISRGYMCFEKGTIVHCLDGDVSL